MTRVVVVIIVIALAVAFFTLLWDHSIQRYRAAQDRKHRDWIPGSKPMVKPPAGKRWAFDTNREEWYLDEL